MSPSSDGAPPVVPVALGSVHSSTEESRAFLQQRLGLFGMWVFCLSVGSLLTGVGVTLVFDPDGYWGWGVSEPPNFFLLAATLVPGGVWLLSRKTTMPFHLLRRLDAGALIATCALFAPGRPAGQRSGARRTATYLPIGRGLDTGASGQLVDRAARQAAAGRRVGNDTSRVRRGRD